jgi:hypothetical protein
MIRLFAMGGPYMILLTLLAIVILVLAVKKATDLFARTGLERDRLTRGLDAILFWGDQPESGRGGNRRLADHDDLRSRHPRRLGASLVRLEIARRRSRRPEGRSRRSLSAGRAQPRARPPVNPRTTRDGTGRHVRRRIVP